MPRPAFRAVWITFILWLAHNAEEMTTGLSDFLKGGHFFGLYVGTRHASEWATIAFQLSTLGLLALLTRSSARWAKVVLTALMILIPLDAVHHVAFRMPGLYTAVAIGVPSGAWAVLSLRRAGVSGRDVLLAGAAGAVAYVPMCVVATNVGLLCDRMIPLSSLGAAIAVWGVVTAACLAVAVFSLRQPGHEPKMALA